MRAVHTIVLVSLAVATVAPASAEVTFEWVTVGNPGNPADPLNEASVPDIGSVGYEYRISKHPVTNDQYAEFLNAVGATDTGEIRQIWLEQMGTDPRGGITRSGSPGSYTYTVKPNMGDKPVNLVSFLSAMRFVNWLHNGQPTGPQDATTTEDGVYTIDLGPEPDPGDGISETRAADARFFVPTDNEWYKAAFHQPAVDGGDTDDYWLYSTASNTIPTQAIANATGDINNPGANVANYDRGADWNGQDGNVTTVGSAGPLSASYYGTTDQSGNLIEWTESLKQEDPNPGCPAPPCSRVIRGGSWDNPEILMQSTQQLSFAPRFADQRVGFRVASPVEQMVTWEQLGEDIDGEAANDESGSAVALSSDGNRVAIAAQFNSGNGLNAGHMRVFDWNGSAWVQVGTDIDGEAEGHQDSFSMALSSDGSRVAIGSPLPSHVRVFEWDGSAWVQVGTNIDEETPGDFFGWSAALSADGSRVAIGAVFNDDAGEDAGHVRVFDWSGSAWVQVGMDIDGEAGRPPETCNCCAGGDGLGCDDTGCEATVCAEEAYCCNDVWDGYCDFLAADLCGCCGEPGDEFGSRIAMSADGSRVAIGSIFNDGAGENAGHVRVFDWNGSAWVQVGADIDGEAPGDYSGWSIALSSDGSRVAIGAIWNAGNGTLAGHVRVFDWNGSAWVQVGADIDGEAEGDGSGSSVALSSGGSRLAIGAAGAPGGGTVRGHVRVFDWNGSAWSQVGMDIDGEADYDSSGESVALSSDGSRTAIGAKFNSGSALFSGHVRVYSSAGVVLPGSPSGRVPDGTDVMTSPMTVDLAGGDLTLRWDPSCLLGDDDYEIYEGQIGNFTSHEPVFCTTGGATIQTFTPGAGNTYYLVVPTSSSAEGSYGLDSNGAERPLGPSACKVRLIEACP